MSPTRGVPGSPCSIVHHRFRSFVDRAMPATGEASFVGGKSSVSGHWVGWHSNRSATALPRSSRSLNSEERRRRHLLINTRPGLPCDLKAHLYSYSFDRLTPKWSRLCRTQYILYFEQCAQRTNIGGSART